RIGTYARSGHRRAFLVADRPADRRVWIEPHGRRRVGVDNFGPDLCGAKARSLTWRDVDRIRAGVQAEPRRSCRARLATALLLACDGERTHAGPGHRRPRWSAHDDGERPDGRWRRRRGHGRRRLARDQRDDAALYRHAVSRLGGGHALGHLATKPPWDLRDRDALREHLADGAVP